ncbi:hypothetical protein [Vibrio parahaemolyticus]|uniref:hypothetical protein n=1 Tax=Vibrio parahaemolyticus TaxID=670 RepID=UPI0004DED957|nr:hypothetical protein [Vibrio parahaemolyticus]EJA3094931.1 hypothetical protein [Vibrio parahaemolyticus]MBD6984054.1 hypothetical protein [Vibrio parahaemolyticus]MBD6987302.1 hypothetical protein [Vibrio parahaemolyticus]HCH3520450.1 hypothetical protein [Vibrio parahaemolyticus]HCH6534884.1 hypothetical protein [Vibrio parahaemolyticus]
MKDYANCTPYEFKLMVLAQLDLAANYQMMNDCEDYFRSVLEAVNETIEFNKEMIHQLEIRLDKVTGYLKSTARPRNSLKINGLIMLDNTVCEWLKDSRKKLTELKINLNCYEDVHEALMSFGI